MNLIDYLQENGFRLILTNLLEESLCNSLVLVSASFVVVSYRVTIDLTLANVNQSGNLPNLYSRLPLTLTLIRTRLFNFNSDKTQPYKFTDNNKYNNLLKVGEDALILRKSLLFLEQQQSSIETFSIIRVRKAVVDV
jgi:hypothetical protein